MRLALLAAAGYFIYRVRSILVAVLLAIMLTYLVLPVVEFLCRCRFCRIGNRRARRVIATILVFLLLFVLTIFTVKMFLAPFGTELTKLVENSSVYVQQTEQLMSRASEWYQALPPDAREFLKRQDYTKITSGITEFGRNVVASTISWLTHFLDIILVPILAFYFVLDSRSLRRDFLALVPRRRLRDALIITRNIAETLQSYIVGQLILCLLAGVLTAAMLSLLKMDYVLVLSVFAGITRAIPFLGPAISGVPIILLGIATGSLRTGFWLLGFVIVIHFTESKFIMPKLIGHRMRLHPAIVIIVLLIGAEFFGVLGMFLAAPFAAVTRELIRSYIIRPRRRDDLSEVAAPEFTGVNFRSDKL